MIEALLLHGETRPLTCLPARATSAASEIVEEGLRWEEANRSLWPNSEFHEESLPAMPALLFLRAQSNNNTMVVRLAMGIAKDTMIWTMASATGQENPPMDRVGGS
jgi:hypothetical protein